MAKTTTRRQPKPDPATPVLSVLMPVYNEIHTVRAICERVLEVGQEIPLELVIVDDGSQDGSAAVIDAIAASDARVRVVHFAQNRGKAAAVAQAIELARGEYSIFQDADLEYDPHDYPAMLRPLREGVADVVYGSRFTGPERRVHLYLHQVVNNALTLCSNLVTNLNLTDMETCYKAFRTDLLKTVPIKSKGFGIEPELTVKIARLGARVYEVPIRYRGRSYWEGKKIGWKDGVSAFATLAKYRFFDHHFTDHDGLRTLRAMAGATRMNRDLVARLLPFLGQRVLEVGAGIGNLSQHLVGVERLLLCELDPVHRGYLERHFGHLSHVRVLPLDLTDRKACSALANERVESVLCANVLEHIADDQLALANCHRLLPVGGRVVVQVPLGPWLFGSIDRAVAHERRYTAAELGDKLASAGFVLEHTFDLYRSSVPGWWLNGKVLQRREVSGAQVALLDAVYPVLRQVDRVLPWPGLSLVAVGRKER